MSVPSVRSPLRQTTPAPQTVPASQFGCGTLLAPTTQPVPTTQTSPLETLDLAEVGRVYSNTSLSTVLECKPDRVKFCKDVCDDKELLKELSALKSKHALERKNMILERLRVLYKKKLLTDLQKFDE